MSTEDDMTSQAGFDDGAMGTPGAPTPLTALEGVNGLSARDIKLIMDGGYHTVESVAYTHVYASKAGTNMQLT